MLLLLSKYKMKSIPVVDLGEGKIENVITQSAVIHMLAECAGLHWFESWGTKKLSEVGLPMVSANRIIKVCEFSHFTKHLLGFLKKIFVFLIHELSSCRFTRTSQCYKHLS